MSKLEDLKRKKAEIEAQIATEENAEINLRDLTSISFAEKETFFDAMYAAGKAYIERRLANESVKDDAHYIFEEAIMGCFGKDIFEKLNKRR